MMRLDQEADLVVDPADQRVEDVDREVDDRLAVCALQMRVRVGSFGAGRRQSQVIHRGRASDMGMSNESKIAKGGESAIDRGSVNSRSRCFRAGYDLVGG